MFIIMLRLGGRGLLKSLCVFKFKLLLQLCVVVPLLLLNYNVTCSVFMTKSTAEIS